MLETFFVTIFVHFAKSQKYQIVRKRIEKVSFCKVFEKGVDPFGFWHEIGNLDFEDKHSKFV